jgi:TonB-linked SusC/RagA family outer membrane protein
MGFSQSISIEGDSLEIRQVIKSIERQSDYRFFYTDGLTDLSRKVSVNFAAQSVESILSELLVDTQLGYRIINDRLVILAPLEAMQQGIIVTGNISDGTGPLPGVNVTIKGTMQGVVTDANGRFSIAVPGKDAVLVFSFVGYATMEAPVGDRTVFDILLTENVREIEEVVVVGYGVQKKESSVAAITQVSGNEMLKMNATNVTNALAGQVSGVSIVQNSGQPGEDAGRIFIRGVSSWQSSDPLVLVDGIERNFSQIDPNEIETLSVLKDASATAVFGVRGANGVILITTKRGTKQTVKVTATAELTAKQPINVLRPMDSYQTALVRNEANKNDNNWGELISDEVLAHYRDQDLPWIYPNTSWQDLMLKDNVFSHKYNVNVSGGTDFARVFASVSYLYDGDIIKTEKQPDYDPSWKYNRYNYRFNVDTDLTKSTLLSLDAGGFIGIINRPYETNSQRLLRPIYMLGPYIVPPGYPAEVLEQYPDPTRPDETGYRVGGSGTANSENPMVANNYSGQRTTKRTDLSATVQLKQKLDFITQGLSVSGKVAYMHNMAYVRTWSLDAITYHLNPNGVWLRYKGRAGAIDGEQAASPVIYEGESVSGDPSRSWYFEATLNYARSFGKHSVTGLILGQRHKRQTNVAFPSFEEGIVGRVTYDYDARYSMEVNLGYNGSEQFAPQNRYGFFPSFGAGWNLHNEKFFTPIKPVIGRARIKATYGEVGSDASSSRWLYTSSYLNQRNAYANDKYWPGILTTNTYVDSIIEENAANLYATWEKAVKQDIGVELAFLKGNMFVLTVDFFKEQRSQILLDRMSVPAWFGVGMKQQNLGETETKGYEIELKYQHSVGDFNYWLKPTVSFSDNRIISRDEPEYKPEYQKQAGHRIHQLFGWVHTDWIQDGDEMMHSARLAGGLMGLGDTQWVDFNGDGVIDENDAVAFGYSAQYPLYNYSLGGGFKFRNFEFDFLFQAVSHFNRQVVDAFAWPLHRLGDHVFEYQLDRWTPDNRDSRYPAFHDDVNRNHNNGIEGASVRTTSVYDASYIRLKQIGLTYNLPKVLVEKMKLDNFSVYLRGNNIFTYAPHYPLADPEGADGNVGRVTNGFYPLVRRISLGMQITF